MKKILLILLCLPMIFSCGDEGKIKKLEDRIAELENKKENKDEESFSKKASVIMEHAVEVIDTQLNTSEKEAEEDMFLAVLYFQKDSFNLALNGDGQYLGFLDIADEYSSTKAGALANYYSGLAYLNTGDFENAIKYLGDFSSDDIVLSALALGCIGDSYMELADTDNALSYYEDAAEKNINEFTTPRYMFKQAKIHEKNGDFATALSLYKVIESDYKTSAEGNGIEKYIAIAENAL